MTGDVAFANPIAKIVSPVMLDGAGAVRWPVRLGSGVFILEKKRESDGGLPDAAPHFDVRVTSGIITLLLLRDAASIQRSRMSWVK
jgi:hypothetical protein